MRRPSARFNTFVSASWPGCSGSGSTIRSYAPYFLSHCSKAASVGAAFETEAFEDLAVFEVAARAARPSEPVTSRSARTGSVKFPQTRKTPEGFDIESGLKGKAPYEQGGQGCSRTKSHCHKSTVRGRALTPAHFKVYIIYIMGQGCIVADTSEGVPASGYFLAQSLRNLARPMSVSGCLVRSRRTLSGIVMASAPSSAAWEKWLALRMLAARTCVGSS